MREKTNFKEEIIVENVKDFNLDHIFDCGQAFRWKKEEDGSYSGKAFGKAINIGFKYDGIEKSKGKSKEKSSGTLILKNSSKEDYEKIWKKYLDLDRDYGKIKRELGTKDSVLKEAIKSGEGIRILNQDLWETIISFIISQNNNIPRIKKCIESLACSFGDGISLPNPEELSILREEELLSIKLGYRSKYLIETAKQVVNNGLPKNFDELLELNGVGPKVANCISLFGMHHLESFPIDVWVKRLMNKYYGFDEKDTKGMEIFAQNTFGDYGGIAQQYLFYHIRKEELSKN